MKRQVGAELSPSVVDSYPRLVNINGPSVPRRTCLRSSIGGRPCQLATASAIGVIFHNQRDRAHFQSRQKRAVRLAVLKPAKARQVWEEGKICHGFGRNGHQSIAGAWLPKWKKMLDVARPTVKAAGLVQCRDLCQLIVWNGQIGEISLRLGNNGLVVPLNIDLAFWYSAAKTQM